MKEKLLKKIERLENIIGLLLDNLESDFKVYDENSYQMLHHHDVSKIEEVQQCFEWTDSGYRLKEEK